jgi:hypothetical protein
MARRARYGESGARDRRWTRGRGRETEDHRGGTAGDGGSCKVTKMNRAASAPEEIKRERAQLARIIHGGVDFLEVSGD